MVLNGWARSALVTIPRFCIFFTFCNFEGQREHEICQMPGPLEAFSQNTYQKMF